MMGRTGILQGLRSERTPLALLAALALVFNILASFAPAAANASGTPAGLVICSAAGAEALPGSGNASPHGGDFCPCGAACAHLACCAALLDPSAEETAVYTPSSKQRGLPRCAGKVIAGASFLTRGIRAPPFS
ncbi:hypothetical protein HPQ64_18570 [Rhizobiales bacterium]|uniref:hypothetical protein n=1 Tax=Hongsoonwoonella zoysiae TaxID=2821844 RepID=UPI0015605B8A|nr:hypothetical protein [Hongsoonwoonella zoysiae]NRG19699.1 hypothetical protein [Hongsoonwoonella zoysiae]